MKRARLLLVALCVLAASVQSRQPTAAAIQDPLAPLTLRIGTPRPGSYDVASIALEPYVARVLAGEALPGSSPAALEALAIAIRTYTIRNMGVHRNDGFDLCNSTHCQVMRNATVETERAAQATAGQVLLYKGTTATVYYSASCGGYTELPSAVWPSAENQPYLPARPDDGCGGSPEWKSELALSDLRRSFQAAGYKGTLRDMRVVSRDGSGRVAKLALDGLTPAEISGQDLRMVMGATLGWTHIRSALFDMRRQRDAFRFEGRGFGHGVGMCVIGSAKLAQAGESAAAILARYYPGTTIALAPSSAPAVSTATASPAPPLSATTAAPPVVAGISVIVPEDDISDRETLQDLASHARDELATALGLPPPAQVKVRAHRSASDYERATGRPWFTLGTTLNGEIHLVPTRTLRERGILESIVQRQMVHLLIDGPLSKRPVWVLVGAALFFTSPPPAKGASFSRERCPSDAELLRPVSAGALSTAYSQAYACFARQATSGRKWRDVR